MVKECDGIIVNGYGATEKDGVIVKKGLTIPEGSVATKKQSNNGRQRYAAHSTSCHAVAVVFNLNALNEFLHRHMLAPSPAKSKSLNAPVPFPPPWPLSWHLVHLCSTILSLFFRHIMCMLVWLMPPRI